MSKTKTNDGSTALQWAKMRDQLNHVQYQNAGQVNQPKCEIPPWFKEYIYYISIIKLAIV